MTALKIESPILTMPSELRLFTLNNCIAASPYNKYTSGSYYNTKEKSWDFTPEGAIRVSDHWNFYSRGTKHCITDIDNSKIEGKWITAQYYNGIWNVISADDKDFTALNLKEKRREQKQFTDSLIVIKNKCKERLALRLARMQRRREAERKALRLKYINAGFIFYKGYVTDYYRRKGGWFGSTDTNVCGMIHNESRCRTNGRQVNGYKEIDIIEFIKEISSIKSEVKKVLLMNESDFLTYKNCFKPEIIAAINTIQEFDMKSTFLAIEKRTSAL
jgi:hypothetical protein